MSEDLEQSQDSWKCRHGTRERSVIVCHRDFRETGAKEIWRTYEKDGYIVTTYFCREKCLWKKGRS